MHFPIFSLELAILRAEASNVYFMNKTIDYKGVRLSGGEETTKKCAKNIFFVAYFQQKKKDDFIRKLNTKTDLRTSVDAIQDVSYLSDIILDFSSDSHTQDSRDNKGEIKRSN